MYLLCSRLLLWSKIQTFKTSHCVTIWYVHLQPIVRFHCFGIYLHTKWRHGDNRKRCRYVERQSPHYSEYVDNMLTTESTLCRMNMLAISWPHWTEYVWCWQYVCNWAALCRTEYVCKFAGSLCRRDAKAGLVQLVNMWRWRWRDGHTESGGRA